MQNADRPDNPAAKDDWGTSTMGIQNLGTATIATSLPDGEVGPTDAGGAPISPNVTDDFQGPIPTNEFYSALHFPFFEANNAGVMHANPLSMKAVSGGLDLGYTADARVVGSPGLEKYEYSYAYNAATNQGGDLNIGLAGLDGTQAKLADHGDWTATADWGGAMQATFGQGMPFVYVTRDSDADAEITLHQQKVDAVGTPVQPLTYTLDGLNGQFDGSALQFRVPVDAGTDVAEGVQFRISFDFDGDGRFDRVETYNFHPTDAVDGWETYAQDKGLFSQSGAMADMVGGSVKVELWRAIGDGHFSVQADSADSFVDLPFANLTVDGAPANGGRLFLQGGAAVGGDGGALATAPGAAPSVDSTADAAPSVPGWDGPGTVWFAADGVVGLTVNGTHYGIFGPSGSTWSFTETGLVSDLDGKDYFSVAALPDNSVDTLMAFQKHAYAFVTDSTVTYDVNQATGKVETHFEVATQLMEQGGDLADTPLLSLYRHQYINSDAALSDFAYNSARGEMKVLAGDSFTTVMDTNPILPALPFAGDSAQASVLRAMLGAEATNVLANLVPYEDTYTVGKELARLGNLAQIANQLGDTDSRDVFLDTMRTELNDWFDATDGTAKLFYYNEEWDTLQGYPASFHTETQVNDHHFHYGYFVDAAATLAEFDPDWAAAGNNREIVNELVADAANWDRANEDYPYLRSFDNYAGHGWASGHGAFPSGNNQESSSESLNFSSAVARWGAATGQDELTDLGLYLHTVETEAVQQYWFDVDGEVFPAGFDYGAVGMVWSDGGAHSTWFSADPEKIFGINFLPATGGGLFLAENPEEILANVAAIEAARGGDPVVWKNLVWQYLALADPETALARFQADPNATQTAGETGIENGGSAAHTLHWLQTLAEIGTLRPDLRADTPFAAAFEKDGAISYIAYNAGSEARTVTFSDGTVLQLQARSMSLLDSDGTLQVYDYALAGSGGDTGGGDTGGGDTGGGDTGGGDTGGGDTGGGDTGGGDTGGGDTGGGDTGHDGLGLAVGADGRLLFGNADPVAVSDAQGYTVNAPTNALSFTLEGLNGAYDGSGASSFSLALDAGGMAGNGTQMRISYDFDGDGTVDRIESFDILPTDDVAGFQSFGTTSLIQAQGAFADFAGGKVTVEIWNAFGPGGISFDPAASSITLPFALEAGSGTGGSTGGGDTGGGDTGGGDTGGGDTGGGDTGGGGTGGGDLALTLTGDGNLQFAATEPVTVAAAQGYSVNAPAGAVAVTLDGLNGAYDGSGASGFALALDAGQSVGNGTQLRLSYDFDGNGTIDRIESFDVLPTDDVAGFQSFATTSMIQQQGGYGDFADGSLTVEIWNAFGPGEVRFDPAASSLTLPFDLALGAGGGGGDTGGGDTGGGDTGGGDTGGAGHGAFTVTASGELQLSGTDPVSMQSASGGHFVHNPQNAVSFTADNLDGAIEAGTAPGFRIALDAGSGAGNGTQVQLTYDFDGNGTIDRTELYDVLPTNDLPGFESFGTSSLLIAEGEMGSFSDGSVTMTVWNAFGTGDVVLDPTGTRLTLSLDGLAPGGDGGEDDGAGTGAGDAEAWTLYLAEDGNLQSEAPAVNATETLAPAGEGGTAVFSLDGIDASYTGGSLDFAAMLDAGQSAGNGVALQVQMDFDGDGSFDRTEEFAYFATNDLAGGETYAGTAGPQSVSGSDYQDFAGGKLVATFKTMIGTGAVDLGFGGTDMSSLLLPYQTA